MGEPEFTIDNADQYPQILLERGKVIADYEQRKAKIKADAEEATRQIGGNADLSDSLLEEVTSLVEWPVVLTAKFEEKFLAVPAEALVYTMKAVALNEQYQPRFAGDELPSNPVACAVAIADKMDTLAGIFGIGQHPKGDKDPFALRRAALGVLRIIVEKNLNLDLQTLTEEAVRLYGDKLTNANVVDDVIDFMLGRFRAWYQDEGYTVDTIQAVLARRPTRPADFDARMKAVSHFRTLEAASALAAANKRVSNILAKSDETLNERVNAATLKEPEEIALAMQVVVLRDKLEPYFAEGRYQEALVELAELRDVIDAFFEKVMVNVEDKELRINRLSMLDKLRELFLRVADISLLQ
ncbi:hypothetical protein L1887_52693 [Cichorium endivia]|nr:hypothetical protein L1887_52693 [Cichorium endivia]